MAISKISSSSIDPNVSLGDGFLKVDSTNNRVGIGTSNPNFDLDVSVGSLGTTNGDSLSAFRLHSTTGNNDYLNFSKIRESDGIYWNTAGWRIQQKVDSTDMGYIQFNGSDNVQGLSFGTANTERMRIDSAGRVTMPYQPSFWAQLAANYTPGAVSNHAIGTSNGCSINVNHNTGNHYNSATGVFTAPVAGVYLFGINDLYYAGTGYIQTGITINNGQLAAIKYTDSTGTVYDSAAITITVRLMANDTAKFFLNSSVSNSFLHSGGYNNMFGYLIG